ncbi:DUF883 domain-containing protein [Polynucleobacter sp. 15G-AUS-farblos]|uniref:DUF883 family protein n=1 Tax=Polynucleobacter sp. 15G-AUS-farblos TaxID=2689094 RepID=UPI001C0E4144|nr:DUF883 family protein [Polynucleobacter sp. 15G-AUS-farblos]MBU3582438.1 DUF883 domain-containing protein [Polynucleobacter sp. 15G-AUS-farblos]
MTNNKSTSATSHDELHSDQLIGDFKALMADAEALIKATASHEDGTIASIRSKAMDTLTSAKENLSLLEGPLTEKAKAVAEGADDFVHRKPWEAVGVAAGLGLLIGLLIRRH